MTEDLDAHTRLTHAITALTSPTPHVLHRDAQEFRSELDRNHVAFIRWLRRRRDTTLERLPTLTSDTLRATAQADADRVLDAIRAAGPPHRARRAALRAQLTTTPSLIEQLLEAVHGSGGTNGARGAGANRSPIGLAAAQLLHDIRRWTQTSDHDPSAALRTWQGDPDTAETWLTTARAILEPARWGEAKAACPVCHTLHVWIDQDGEQVRQAALQVNYTHGYAQCMAKACGTVWPRERLNHLAAVLRDDLATP